MKFSAKNKTKNNPDIILRKAGYRYIGEGERTAVLSFIRPLDQNFYPRFHLYLEQGQNNQLSFTLHLDQKRPRYKGATAHNADYEGPVVEKEAQRIKDFFWKKW